MEYEKRVIAREVAQAMLGVAVVVALIWFGVTYTLPNQPLNGQGNCGDGFIAKDGSFPFEYSGNQNVCKVIVKAGSQGQGEACYGFKYPPASQSDGCYNVSGLGSTSVRVGGGGTSPECKEISHVEFYACPATSTQPPRDTATNTSPPTLTPTSTEVRSTETNTPTNTATVFETPTPISTTPFKFWTPTPLGSATITPTEPTEYTITPTGQTPTQLLGTPTTTGTPEPGKPKRTPTGTPELLRLPNTGEAGPGGDERGQWLGVGIVIIGILWILGSAVRKARQ